MLQYFKFITRLPLIYITILINLNLDNKSDQEKTWKFSIALSYNIKITD